MTKSSETLTHLVNEELYPTIDGVKRSPEGEGQFERLNPASGRVASAIGECSAGQIDQAIASARRGYRSWVSTGPAERKRVLFAIAEHIEKNADALARFDCLEVGKPISAAMFEAGIAAAFFRYYAEAVDKRYGRTAPSCLNSLEVQKYCPRGVVAAITPWNFPVINMALKVAPILAAGNAVVAKPSEYSVGSASLLARLAVEAGLPTGAFNVVTGSGNVGERLVSHPGVDMVTFTGSTQTGLAITRSIGATRLKASMLECGGKSPALVFHDAIQEDLDGVAACCVGGALWNQGQVCVARTRLLVEDAAFDEFSAKVADICGSTQIGPPDQPQTQFGPLANLAQLEKTKAYLEVGSQQAGELLVDGRKFEFPNSDGFYVGPSVLANVDQQSRTVQEEIFGPVITIQRFQDEAEAVALANGTDYGLAATLWTTSLTRGHRVAAGINAGTVVVQGSAAQVEGSGIAHAAEPFGQSGFGAEGGLAALDSYSYLKATAFHFG